MYKPSFNPSSVNIDFPLQSNRLSTFGVLVGLITKVCLLGLTIGAGVPVGSVVNTKLQEPS